ncbi:MAG TPA: polyprenyl synthetase family protein [Mycobacteriales bacterium]|nr:polyprenyl synthetase family protein [Mycobacteriales bacterium]
MATAGSAAGVLGMTVAAELDQALASGLAAVEAALLDAVSTADQLVNETASHLVRAGGKRFRPLVALLAAQFGDPSSPGVVPAAVVVELTHLATLYHDDVMDEASMRRGADSANSRWGNSIAILTGDYLFARASDVLADLGPEAVRLQARTFDRLVQGQIHETVGPAEGDDAVEHYLQVVADKTGSLIGTSARFGALLSGVPADQVELLTQWGEQIGVAFQLADDLLDVASDSAESGKTPGTDLREHVPTLPVLLLRRAARPEDADLLAALDSDLSGDAALADVLKQLREHPVMEEAAEVTRGWGDKAHESLSALPAGQARDALASLCDAVTNRRI